MPATVARSFWRISRMTAGKYLGSALMTATLRSAPRDRATRPRVWVETAPYDPDLPIRGRYVSLQIVVDAPGIEPPPEDRSWETFNGWFEFEFLDAPWDVVAEPLHSNPPPAEAMEWD